MKIFGKAFSREDLKKLFSKETLSKIASHKMFESETANRTVQALTAFFIASFMLFETFTWGKYITIVTTMLILVFAFFANGKRLKICFGAYHIFLAAFVIYTAITALWGISASDAISKAFTLGQILLVMSVLYLHYRGKENVSELLSAIKWSGYIVVIYSVLYYGLDLIVFAEGARLENIFTNVNSIGLVAAIACIIQTHELLNKKLAWSALLVIPSVVVLSATQSRKALVFMAAGVFALIALKLLEGKSVKKSILILTGLGVLGVAALLIMTQIPIFDGIFERMEHLVASVTGQGEVDSSTMLRNNMTKVGMHYFKKYPIGGVGIGSPHYITELYLDRDTYLHNNFVELLCGGGIIGLIVYYSMYVYLFISLLRYRKADKRHFTVCFVWLVLMLAMDYGMVSYYSKLQWSYLLLQFINVECLRRKHKEQKEKERAESYESEKDIQVGA